MAVDLGNQTTLTWVGFTGLLTSVNWTMSRGSVETTSMGTTGARTFRSDELYDSGDVNAEVQFNDEQVSPVLTGTAATLTIKWAGETPNAWTADAFCTGYTANASIGELMSSSVSFKIGTEVGTA